MDNPRQPVERYPVQLEHLSIKYTHTHTHIPRTL
jgi:hypothetical protein